MEIRHKKEVDYETVDQPNAEQNGGGGKGNASAPKGNKYTWIAAAVLAVAIITLILLLTLNGR